MGMGWTRATRNNVMLVLVSVVFCLYLIEMLLWFFQSGDSRSAKLVEKAAERGVRFDTRSVIELLRDLKTEGTEAYPAIWPGAIIRKKGLENGFAWEGGWILPLAGISRALTILGNETGEYALYQSDEHGFNNPPGLFREGRVDMALIGDSITQGCCVNPGEDLGSLLRKTGLRVLNLGYGFNGPLLELATLREYARPIRPQVVLWCYFEGNDLDELVAEAQGSSRLMAYLETGFSQGLLGKQDVIDQILRRHFRSSLDHAKRNPWDVDGGNHAIKRIATMSYLRERLGIGKLLSRPFDKALFGRIFEQANEDVDSWGGRLVFVFLPARERFLNGSKSETLFHRREVLSMVREMNIPLVDIVKAFVTHTNPLSLFPFGIEPHYNQNGYELVAATIVHDLDELGIP